MTKLRWYHKVVTFFASMYFVLRYGFNGAHEKLEAENKRLIVDLTYRIKRLNDQY